MTRHVAMLPSLLPLRSAVMVRAFTPVISASAATVTPRRRPISRLARVPMEQDVGGDLDIRRIPPDMLRHTSETLLQAAGLQDPLVSRLHGHTELKTCYAH